jgi:hypothetical protein
VVVVVVVVPLVAGLVEEELPVLPPHPATAKVVVRVATSVSIAVSGVLFMGWPPIFAPGLGGSPYQPFATRIAAW